MDNFSEGGQFLIYFVKKSSYNYQPYTMKLHHFTASKESPHKPLHKKTVLPFLSSLLLLLLLPTLSEAQVRPEEPLLSATTEKRQGEYLTFQISSSDYFWIDWGNGVPKRYTKGSYGEENPIFSTVSGSQIKVYGESISHIIAPMGGWTTATIGLSLQLLNIDLSNSPLTEINLSESSLLNSLNVSYCRLQELQLGKKSKLTYLWAGGNEFSSIDLSQCSSLEQLDLSSNQLAGSISLGKSVISADLSGNKLTEVKVAPEGKIEDLSIRSNALSQFSIADVPSLRSLDLYQNKLTSLVFQGNFPNFVSLNAGKNELKEIDLNSCPELRGLTLSYNPLSVVNISNCKELSSLSIHHTALTELDLKAVKKLKNLEAMSSKLTRVDLSACPELIEIWLSQNLISELKLASSNESLLSLQLAGNRLSATSIEGIITALPDITEVYVPPYQEDYLKHLSIRYNPNTNAVNIQPAIDKGWVLDVEPSKQYSYASFTTSNPEDREIAISVEAPAESEIILLGNIQKKRQSDGSLLTLQEVTTQAQQLYYLESKATLLDFSKAQLESIDLYNCSELSSLNVQNGKLTSLDLTSAPKLQELYCLQNSLSSENMTQLIATLPDRSASQDGILYAIHLDKSQENNACNPKHIQKAKAKGWTIKAFDPKEDKYIDYAPSETPYTTDQPAITLTTAKTKGKWQLSLGISKKDKATAWVDLNNNGQYDEGEEKFQLYKLWKPAIDAQTITLYGKFNWVACTLNELTALDLSQNNHITYLACDGNKLNQLDLSHNTLLEKLYCNDNQLTELDLSAQVDLKELYCFDNPSLKKLDLTKQSKLEELYTNRCALQELLLDSHPVLTQLKADENQLSSINVSKTPALKKLWLASNKLTEIDLSSNTNLDELQVQLNKLTRLALPSESALAVLSCAANPLDQIDLSKQTKLTFLDCSLTKLSLLELPASPDFKELYCYSNQLTRETLDRVLEALPSRTADDGAFAIIVNSTDSSEKNEASDKKVLLAKEKGWKIYDYKGGENYGYNPYEGINATDIPTAEQPEVVISGHELSIRGGYTSLAIYTLSGELLSRTAPLLLHRGEYIVVISDGAERIAQKITVAP